jgi:hypothetical protein
MYSYYLQQQGILKCIWAVPPNWYFNMILKDLAKRNITTGLFGLGVSNENVDI